MDAIKKGSVRSCRHRGLRMVYISANFCLKRYALFRRHPLRRESRTEKDSVLDEFSIFYYIHNRNVPQMDRFGFPQVFYQFLDATGLFDCFRKCTKTPLKH